eukprot:scaffold27103_cov79-Skeletonema_dohrnii-CCMP3373.AAC.1
MVAVALMKSNQDAVASLQAAVDPKDRKVRLLALLETMPKKEECASSISMGLAKRACERCRSKDTHRPRLGKEEGRGRSSGEHWGA